jgi:hypothetical protein
MLPISNVAIPNAQFQSTYAKATAYKLELARLVLATFPHWQHSQAPRRRGVTPPNRITPVVERAVT